MYAAVNLSHNQILFSHQNVHIAFQVILLKQFFCCSGASVLQKTPVKHMSLGGDKGSQQNSEALITQTLTGSVTGDSRDCSGAAQWLTIGGCSFPQQPPAGKVYRLLQRIKQGGNVAELSL